MSASLAAPSQCSFVASLVHPPFQGSRTELLLCESRFGGLKVANRRFEAIRANRSHVMKIGVFCESTRPNRPDSCCESPGHLSLSIFVATAIIVVISWGRFLIQTPTTVATAVR